MFLLEEQLDYLSQINDYLFLSSVGSLSQVDQFSLLGITHIVSVMINPPALPESIKHLTIRIQDSEQENIQIHFEEVFDFIKDAKQNNSKVLIHCEKGISRSASFVIAWLLNEKHHKDFSVDYEATLRFVKKIRMSVAPNKGFSKQLKEYEKSLNHLLSEKFSPSLKNLPKELQRHIFSYLSPRDLLSLGSVSCFFRLRTSENVIWEAHLNKYLKLQPDHDETLSAHNISFKNLYSSLIRIKNFGFPKTSLALVVGFSGNHLLSLDLIKQSNNKDEVIRDILFGAATGSHLDLIKTIAHNWNILVKDKESKLNILCFAVAVNNLSLLEYVYSIDKSAEHWQIINKQGDNLLFMAAYYGSLECFKFLYETVKLNPLTINLSGETLLFKLSLSHNVELARYIKENISELQPQLKNNSGLSAYELARRKSNTEICEIYDQWMLEQSTLTTLNI